MQIPTEAERNLPTTALKETGGNANREAAHSISDVAARRGEIIPVSTASESETSSRSDTSTSQSDEKVNFSSWSRALTVQTVQQRFCWFKIRYFAALVMKISE